MRPSAPRVPRLPRPTIRLRLTLLYGALFLLTAAVLLGLTYVISASTGLTVSVGADGEVRVTFGDPFGGGGSNTLVAPFGGSPAALHRADPIGGRRAVRRASSTTTSSYR